MDYQEARHLADQEIARMKQTILDRVKEINERIEPHGLRYELRPAFVTRISQDGTWAS